MRILQLSVSRFRSLRAVESWQPGVLNVLIGPNGSGKSNVLRAIEFLATSAQGRLARMVQSSGGMDSLIWDGRADEFDLVIRCDSKKSMLIDEQYSLRLKRLGRGGDFKVDFELFETFIGNRSAKAFLEQNGAGAWVYDEKANDLIGADKDAVPVQETMLSLLKGPFNRNSTLTDFRSELAGMSVYQELQTNREAAIRQPTITRHETRVDSDGQNLVSVLHTLYTADRNFKNDINDAMTAAFGPDFEELVFPPVSDQRIQMGIRWRSLQRHQSVADLSDGTLRFLFLLTVLASPDPAPLIAIDEPETGLHPSMLPIIAEYAVQASKRAQVIFTTHSPQFLDAFTDTRPQTTVVERVDGETQLKTLDPEQLNVWLQEYSLGSLFRSGELEAMA